MTHKPTSSVKGGIALIVVGLLALTACGTAEESDGTTPEAATTESGGDTESASGTESAPPADELTTVTMASSATSLAAGRTLAALSIEGVFEDQGLDLQYIDTEGNSTNVVAAVEAGEAEFGVLGFTTIVDAASQGANLLVIGGDLTTNSYQLALNKEVADGLEVTADSPLAERAAALEGLTIGTSAAGSLNNTLTQALLANFGLDFERDVNISPSDGPALIAGLDEGLYDAVGWQVGVVEISIANGNAVRWIGVPDDSFGGFDNFFAAVTIVNADYAAENPEIVEAMVAAYRSVDQMISDDPQEVRDVLKGEWFPEVDDEVYALMWEAAVPTWVEESRITEEEFQTHLELQAGLSDGDFSSLDFEEVTHPSARR